MTYASDDPSPTDAARVARSELTLPLLRAGADVAFEAAFKHSYSAMIITDADFDGGPFILRCNPAFCAMTGYTEKELIGRSPRILQGPDTDRKVIDQLKRQIQAGEFFEGSTYNYRKDGGSYVVEWNISPVRDADGATVAYISIQQDITARFSERYQLAQRVTESEALLRAGADSLLDPQVVLEAARDSVGQIVDFLYREVNRATCDYLGMSREELIGRGVVETMPGIRDTLLIGYIRCLDTGEPLILNDFSYDNEILADTRRYDLRATRTTPTSISLTWRDVTERFRMVQSVAESEERYRLLAENSSDVVTHVRDGRFVWISPSATEVLGGPPGYWVGRQVREIIPPEDAFAFARRLATLAAGRTVRERIRVVSVAGVTHWIDLLARPFYDDAGDQDGFTGALRLVDDEVAAQQEANEARVRQARADALYRRSIDSAAVGMCLANLEGNFVQVNDALCAFFGYDAAALRQMTWQQLTAPDYLDADVANVAEIISGRIDSYRLTKQFIHADGHRIWGDLSVSCLRALDGDVEVFIAQITDITKEVTLSEQVARQNERIHRAEERYRRSINNAAVGMCLVTPDGRLSEVNESMCRLFGYAASAMNGTHWQDFTAPGYLEEEQSNWNAILEGRSDSYRMTKHYVHADGHPIWGELAVSAVRNDKGQVENCVALITDVTDQVEADERNRTLTQQLQERTDRVKADLDSAAAYMSSLMPSGMQGPVTVSSRYLPSRELGGDCLDYYWIDDDHLLVKLIDVSGHGLEPALLAVSVHNLMRSGSLPHETLLSPEAVLTELNRLFAMEQQSDHYFTMWYGIYEASTRTLRYASAGAPPALAFNATSTALSTTAAPVGMFEDSEFTSGTYQVPPGCRILIYSDGASEITLADGQQLTAAAFTDLATRVAASEDWSPDDLIDELRALTASGVFEDDFSMIQLTFD